MNTLKILVAIYISMLTISCSQDSSTQKWQMERSNIEDVRDRIVPIHIDEVYFGQMVAPFIIDNYLIITDYNSVDNLIHIFDKTSYKYITSRVRKGRGPGEIIGIGNITSSVAKREVYISDNGKQTIYTYPIDSLINATQYIPHVKMKHDKGHAVVDYEYINDTLSIGLAMVGLGNNDFKAAVAKINFQRGETNFMKYEHPEIKKPRFEYAASLEHNIYVTCYAHHNLMTLCDLNGNLKCNIYGEGWSNKVSNENRHFGKTIICKSKILALYAGKSRLFKKENSAMGANYPDKILVFDTDGNYEKTIELGCQVHRLCYDSDNNRLVFSVQNSVIQFAYLNLTGIL